VICVFDTSALVKLLVDEPGTDATLELWDRTATPMASRLAHPELAAALWGAVRAGRIDRRQMPSIEARAADLLDQLTWLELSPALATFAASLARRLSLSGADAVHVAGAAALGPSTVVATFDERMRSASEAIGLVVTPGQTS
jgi:predicted nucleic acid-binding protein